MSSLLKLGFSAGMITRQTLRIYWFKCWMIEVSGWTGRIFICSWQKECRCLILLRSRMRSRMWRCWSLRRLEVSRRIWTRCCSWRWKEMRGVLMWKRGSSSWRRFRSRSLRIECNECRIRRWGIRLRIWRERLRIWRFILQRGSKICNRWKIMHWNQRIVMILQISNLKLRIQCLKEK